MTGATGDIVAGQTYHRRLAEPANAFRYSVDYLLVDLDDLPRVPLLSGNRLNLFSLHERDHGGPRHDGRGASWTRTVLSSAGWPEHRACRLLLLTQPRFLGFWFCPVSFWLAYAEGELRAVIAEVNNTFGDRHSYLCAHADFRPIAPSDVLKARKIFHVSPFQDISGDYRFRFEISEQRVDIHIRHDTPGGGLVATLSGERRPLSGPALLGSAVRRPLGALRVLGLIYWQALRLALKGARYRPRPSPPARDISR